MGDSGGRRHRRCVRRFPRDGRLAYRCGPRPAGFRRGDRPAQNARPGDVHPFAAADAAHRGRRSLGRRRRFLCHGFGGRGDAAAGPVAGRRHVGANADAARRRGAHRRAGGAGRVQAAWRAAAAASDPAGLKRRRRRRRSRFHGAFRDRLRPRRLGFGDGRLARAGDWPLALAAGRRQPGDRRAARRREGGDERGARRPRRAAGADAPRRRLVARRPTRRGFVSRSGVGARALAVPVLALARHGAAARAFALGTGIADAADRRLQSIPARRRGAHARRPSLRGRA